MEVIKIKADDLLVYLKKTTANGLVEDCKLNFTKEGLSMQHINPQRNILIKGNLAREAFAAYSTMEINIKNTDTLLKVLATFGDNIINIVAQDNMVKIMDSNGSIDLAEAEKVECYSPKSLEKVTDIEYDNSIIIKKAMISTILKRNSIIKSDQVIVELKDKKIAFGIGDKIDKASVNENVTSDKEYKVLYEIGLFEKLTKEMDMLIDLSLHSSAPSRFTENTENFEIEYYIVSIDE